MSNFKSSFSSYPAIATMVVVLLAIAVISFGQQLIVRDNASSTAPLDDLRYLGSGYASVLGFTEVATSTALVNPPASGVLFVQFNTDDQKLYLRVTDSNGANWGGSVSLTTLD